MVWRRARIESSADRVMNLVSSLVQIRLMDTPEPGSVEKGPTGDTAVFDNAGFRVGANLEYLLDSAEWDLARIQEEIDEIRYRRGLPRRPASRP
jgi:hypothetical protein